MPANSVKMLEGNSIWILHLVLLNVLQIPLSWDQASDLAVFITCKWMCLQIHIQCEQSKCKHYDASIYNHKMLLINLTKHTDTFFVFKWIWLVERRSRHAEGRRNNQLWGHIKALRRQKSDGRETAHGLSQPFIFHKAAGLQRCLLPFFGFTPTNFSLHNST